MSTNYNIATSAALKMVDQLLYKEMVELMTKRDRANDLEVLRVSFPSIYKRAYELAGC